HRFDEAAIEAAKKIEFLPATRNGKPVASKVRHKYEFTPPPGRFVGRVLAQPGDEPIAGATVDVTGPDGATFSTKTESNGSFRVQGAPAGTYRITVAASGHVA